MAWRPIDLARGRADDATVRMIGVALLLVIVGLTDAAWRPEAVSACTGRALEFEDALRVSTGSIYAGRIIRAETADTFWVDLTIDIDRVVRGPAAARVRRAQAAYVCDGIQVGQYGYIVRGVGDPDYPSDDQDVFIRVSRSDARAALIAAGLPDTSTLPSHETTAGRAMPWAWLGFWLAAASVLAYRGIRRHPRVGYG